MFHNSSPYASTTKMLPGFLLLIFILYLFTPCLSRELSFTSQFQLDLQHPLAIENQNEIVQFTPSETCSLPPTSARLLSRPTTVYRPRSLDVLHRARLRSLQHAESEAEQPI